VAMTPRKALTIAWERLEGAARQVRDARTLRRLQALAWVGRGESIRSVARRLGVSRWTIYRWIRRWQEERAKPLRERLADRPRPGRPRRLREAVRRALERLMEQDPRAWGYRHTHWTVPLLQAHLREREGLKASSATLRRCLHEMGYRWKRPRFVPRKLDPHWRQAKGGSRGI